LLTPQGPKAIETFQVGDEILTRLEWEPDAPVLVSQVEARFENVARIWHLHLASGQVIRTTAEHPFYVDGRGWVPAGELRPGDLLVSHDGQRVAVAELYDTGTYERVYNLAIRSFHTYFVCDETWPCSVWAHNACKIVSRIREDPRLVREAEDAGKSVQRSLDHLVQELSKGNRNPGIGTKHLFKGILEARARDGARVYFRIKSEEVIEILAKSSKANQPRVIEILRQLYA
jgi:hypothetical protein